MAAVCFILSNLFIAAASTGLSSLIFHRHSFLLRLLSAGVLFPVLVLWIILGLGLVGALNGFNACLAAASLCCLAGLLWQRQRKVKLSEFFLKVSDGLVFGLLLLSGLAGGLFAGRFVFNGTHFSVDDLTYHAVAPAHWLQRADICAGPYNYHYHNPYNAETLACWMMLPFGRDGLAFLAGLYWLALAVLAAFVLFSRAGLDKRWFLPAVLPFFLSNIVLTQATWTFSAVDLAAPAMILAAIAALTGLPHKEQNGSKDKTGPWAIVVLAGLAAGFAAGTKVPFITVCAVLCLWLVWAVKGSFLRRRVPAGLLFTLCALAAGSFWYVRNWILTGNPVFPGQIGPFKGPLTQSIQFGAKLVGIITQYSGDRLFLLDIAKRHTAWPVGLFIMSAIGYAAGLYRGFIKPSASVSQKRTVRLLLIAAATMMITYPMMPFSGANNSPDLPVSVALRFLIGPFLIGLALFGLLFSSSLFWRWLWLIVYLFLAATAWRQTGNALNTVAIALTIIIFFTWPALKGKIAAAVSNPSFVPLMFFLLAGLLTGLALTFPHQQKKTDRRLFAHKFDNAPAGRAWQMLQTLPAGSRVDYFGPYRYCYYPLFGRSLQLRPQPVIRDGSAYVHLYKRWNDDPAGAVWWPRNEPIVPQSWLDNVCRSGTEYFLFVKNGSQWPEQYKILAESGIARPVLEDSEWSLWQVTGRAFESPP